MGNLFGKTKKAPASRITEQDKAILVSYGVKHVVVRKYHPSPLFLLQQLKKQRDKLKQYQKRIELTLVKDRELAKKCLEAGRKE